MCVFVILSSCLFWICVLHKKSQHTTQTNVYWNWLKKFLCTNRKRPKVRVNAIQFGVFYPKIVFTTKKIWLVHHSIQVIVRDFIHSDKILDLDSKWQSAKDRMRQGDCVYVCVCVEKKLITSKNAGQIRSEFLHSSKAKEMILE